MIRVLMCWSGRGVVARCSDEPVRMRQEIPDLWRRLRSTLFGSAMAQNQYAALICRVFLPETLS